MGGWGSGKGMRFNASKKRYRRYTDEVPSIGYRSIIIENTVVAHLQGQLSYGDGIFPFKMCRCILPKGGIWYAFLCDCNRKVHKLYFNNQKFACRYCQGLAYRSENHSKTNRPIAQKWKHLKKLGCSVDCPIRPKWMKQKAFEGVCQRIVFYDQLAYDRFFKGHYEIYEL